MAFFSHLWNSYKEGYPTYKDKETLKIDPLNTYANYHLGAIYSGN